MGRRFPNPFYVLLMVVSTLFVVTSLAYLVGPMVALRARRDPAVVVENPATPGLSQWLDGNAPFLLGAEFFVMFVLSLLAMATDHWFDHGRGVSRGRQGAVAPGGRLP